MLTFKCLDDIPKARLPTHLAQYIEKLLTGITAALQQYDPSVDGHIILITPKDVDGNLCERIGRKWSDSMFEGVSYISDFKCYHAVILHNNQFAVSIVVPDEPWLDSAIKGRIGGASSKLFPETALSVKVRKLLWLYFISSIQKGQRVAQEKLIVTAAQI